MVRNLLVAAVAALLVFAFASGSAEAQQYPPTSGPASTTTEGPAVQGGGLERPPANQGAGVGAGGVGSGQSGSGGGGGLARTGLDVAPMILLGMGLVGAGWLVVDGNRRRVRRSLAGES